MVEHREFDLDAIGDMHADLDGRGVLLALLWARTTSTERAYAFMRALDVSEIHGYRPDLGLRIFTPEALEPGTARTAVQAAQ